MKASVTSERKEVIDCCAVSHLLAGSVLVRCLKDGDSETCLDAAVAGFSSDLHQNLSVGGCLAAAGPWLQDRAAAVVKVDFGGVVMNN